VHTGRLTLGNAKKRSRQAYSLGLDLEGIALVGTLKADRSDRLFGQVCANALRQ